MVQQALPVKPREETTLSVINFLGQGEGVDFKGYLVTNEAESAWSKRKPAVPVVHAIASIDQVEVDSEADFVGQLQ
ncbi:hypothetical protein HO133_006562 [Letharia lupina]|uniref:Uncharacterized protein n=1 Tax=Letharia lupina TaxID=560253 RepID=A0A8H6C6D9_9LECA|nr:uncharacterized protein HO133_006562 [Letharia lupina]KAF6217735.1 hypothetical protein HO133_006562 [Letharia lupina]